MIRTKEEVQKLERASGIELLKVIAILLIVIFHVNQTLNTNWYETIGFNDYYLNLDKSSTNISTLILILLNYCGSLGNTIFFVCLAWFFVNQKEIKIKKIIRISLDVLAISLCWLIPMIIYKGSSGLGVSMIIRSFFPTFFQNNGYITCYILFCCIYPFINIIIENLDKKKHFIVAATLFTCYFFISFIYDFPASSDLLIWISCYFVISYLKIYCPTFCNNKKINLILVYIGLISTISLVLITNFLGLRIEFLSNKTQFWGNNDSILLLILSIGLLNLFRRFSFQNRIINYISSLSMFIYVIHDNILFRSFIRPIIWHKIYLNLGYEQILLWHFLFVLTLFILSSIFAVAYKETIHKLMIKASDWLYQNINNKYEKSINKIMGFLD